MVVGYHGRPGSVVAAGQSPFSHTDQGSGEGVAVGQPQIGPWWFAANETPADKATYDIVLRVPRGQRGAQQRRAGLPRARRRLDPLDAGG